MCRQFSCLPSQLEEEDAGLLRLLAIEQMGRPPEVDNVVAGAEGGGWDG